MEMLGTLKILYYVAIPTDSPREEPVEYRKRLLHTAYCVSLEEASNITTSFRRLNKIEEQYIMAHWQPSPVHL